MQKDTLTFAGSGDRFTYHTDGTETPTLVLAVETAGADWSFSIKASGAHDVTLALDLQKGQLRLTSTGAGFDVQIARVDDAGMQTFTHAANRETSGDALLFDYGAWMGDGTPMTAEVDSGGDGSIDQMLTLGDEG
jgi:hypothetical protein